MQMERAKAAEAKGNLGGISRLSVEGLIHRFPADGGK